MAPTTCSSVTRPNPNPTGPWPGTAWRARTTEPSPGIPLGPKRSKETLRDPPSSSSSLSVIGSVMGRPSSGTRGGLNGGGSSVSSNKTVRKNGGAGVGSGSGGGGSGAGGEGGSGSNKASRGKKSVYRHVPHALKPVHLVAKRNARERRRVQAVNSAFLRLRKHVPYEPRHKRLSKVKTLRVAITYISHLQDLIRDHDRRLSSRQAHHPHPRHHHHHQHHHHHHLNILADAAASSNAVVTACGINTTNNNGGGGGDPSNGVHNNNRDNLSGYDVNYPFVNGGGNCCGEEAMRGQPRSMGLHHHHNHSNHHVMSSSAAAASSSSSPSPSSSSSSHFLHASPHSSAVHGGPVGVEHNMSGSWPDGLHYSGGPIDNSKMPSCATDSALYFLPSCPPPQQHYDVTANGSYPPYDIYPVQSPYQIMR